MEVKSSTSFSSWEVVTAEESPSNPGVILIIVLSPESVAAIGSENGVCVGFVSALEVVASLAVCFPWIAAWFAFFFGNVGFRLLPALLALADSSIRLSNQLDAYKTNLGLSIYLGAGALIPFNKNFSGLIEPRFLYRIKPVSVESYPLKEHRHFAGINLGIRYHFD